MVRLVTKDSSDQTVQFVDNQGQNRLSDHQSHSCQQRSLMRVEPSETRGQQILNSEAIWGETKPSRQCLKPCEQIRRTFWQVTQVQTRWSSLRVSNLAPTQRTCMTCSYCYSESGDRVVLSAVERHWNSSCCREDRPIRALCCCHKLFRLLLVSLLKRQVWSARSA